MAGKHQDRYKRHIVRDDETIIKLLALLNRLPIKKGRIRIKMEGLRQAYRHIETMRLIVIERE